MALNALDIWDILANKTFGSPILFFVGIMLLILFGAVYYGFQQRVTMMLIISSALVFSYFVGSLLAVILILVLAGVGIAFSRLISRG